jgi:tight adherence protein B
MESLLFVLIFISVWMFIWLIGGFSKKREAAKIIDLKLLNLKTGVSINQKVAQIYQQRNKFEQWLQGMFNALSIDNKLLVLGESFTLKHFIFWYFIFFATLSFSYIFMSELVAYWVFVLFLVLSFLLCLAQIDWLIQRRKKAFLKNFPDVLSLLVRSVMAGLTIVESIKIASKDSIPNLVTQEMESISYDLSMGLDLEDALNRASKRVQILDFDFFVSSVTSQQKIGGNITEVLSNLIDVIKGREEIALKIQSSSAEARSGAMVVGALPIVIFVALFILRRDYVMFLINDPSGNTMLYISAGLLTTGILIMKKMINFDI